MLLSVCKQSCIYWARRDPLSCRALGTRGLHPRGVALLYLFAVRALGVFTASGGASLVSNCDRAAPVAGRTRPSRR
jgi:hypothetical protein